jgi:hypothetical protein
MMIPPYITYTFVTVWGEQAVLLVRDTILVLGVVGTILLVPALLIALSARDL